jgi:hypothetical protein
MSVSGCSTASNLALRATASGGAGFDPASTTGAYAPPSDSTAGSADREDRLYRLGQVLTAAPARQAIERSTTLLS